LSPATFDFCNTIEGKADFQVMHPDF
jgi:hypothetical protein